MYMLRRWISSAAVLALPAAFLSCQTPGTSNAESAADERILKLEELTYRDIDSLDREQTIFIITFGNLEEHGPHVPVGSDYFQAVALRDGLAGRLRETHPEYTLVLVPVVPLGEGGFNDFARQFDHIGTFGTRFATLRDVTIDLGSSIARHGFQNIFVIHFHGTPLHNIAFTQAAAFVSERYDVRMVNITSLMFGPELYSSAVLGEHLGEGWEQELGMAGHAGPGETSANLYLRGDLVKPDFKSLPAFPVMSPDELGRMYQREGFRGYMNDPSKASPELGKDLMNNFVERAAGIAAKALAGEDLTTLPRWPDVFPPVAELDETIRLLQERYAQTTAEVQAWLARQR